jgi:cytoskeletal protein CcmA (bactofilin family)
MFSKGSSSKRPSAEPQPSAAQEKAPASKGSTTTPARGVPSILSKDLRILGNLESVGELQIDGVFEGDVTGTSIVLGESGQISGNLHGELVRIAGQISGGVDASKVELDRTAKVLGDIRHDVLSVASGAYVVGKVVRRDSPRAQAETARPSAGAAPSPAAGGGAPTPSVAKPATPGAAAGVKPNAPTPSPGKPV